MSLIKKIVIKKRSAAIIRDIQKSEIKIEKNPEWFFIKEKISILLNHKKLSSFSMYNTGTTENVQAIIQAKNLLEWKSEPSTYEKIYPQIRIGTKQNNHIRKYLMISNIIISLVYF